MRVFLTGATGFIGSYLVPELMGAGHRVVGMTRSDAGDETLARVGAEAFRGDVNDLDRLCEGAREADAVIHAAFNHDFSRLKQHSEEDRAAITALGHALEGSGRRLVVTSGTGLARRTGGAPAVETDPHVGSDTYARAATEEAADAVARRGVHVVVMRLAQVHDTRHQGRIAEHIKLAREKGRVAYVGDGGNRLAAVHVTDAARLYRLALEHGRAGARYHSVAEAGVPMRDIAEAIGAGLKLPVEAIPPEEAKVYFGWLAELAQTDLSACSALTREALGWNPTGADLLSDLHRMDYGAA